MNSVTLNISITHSTSLWLQCSNLVHCLAHVATMGFPAQLSFDLLPTMTPSRDSLKYVWADRASALSLSFRGAGTGVEKMLIYQHGEIPAVQQNSAYFFLSSMKLQLRMGGGWRVNLVFWKRVGERREWLWLSEKCIQMMKLLDIVQVGRILLTELNLHCS